MKRKILLTNIKQKIIEGIIKYKVVLFSKYYGLIANKN